MKIKQPEKNKMSLHLLYKNYLKDKAFVEAWLERGGLKGTLALLFAFSRLLLPFFCGSLLFFVILLLCVSLLWSFGLLSFFASLVLAFLRILPVFGSFLALPSLVCSPLALLFFIFLLLPPPPPPLPPTPPPPRLEC